MEVEKTKYNSSFANSYFGNGSQGERVVSGGASGDKVVSEGDTSLFGNSEELGKQDFLTLLVTQLKYQDPLNPSNDQEFVAQLAQFSNLESSQNIESEISSLSESLKGFVSTQDAGSKSLANSTAASLLGKYALIEKPDFYHSGKESSFRVFKEGNAAAVVKISDSEGNLVYKEALTGNSGYKEFIWNGLTDDGIQAPPGDYTVSLTDPGGSDPRGFAFIEDYINAITYEEGTAKVSVDGESYNLEDIKQIVEISK